MKKRCSYHLTSQYVRVALTTAGSKCYSVVWSCSQELEKLLKDLQELVALYEDLVQLRKSEQQAEVKRRRIDDSAPTSAAAASTTTTTVGNLKSLLSRTCYAMYEGTLYTAVVVDVQSGTQPNVRLTN